MRRVLFFVLSFLFVPLFSQAASFDPVAEWKTLHGDHFDVHFHSGDEALAQRALLIAEDVHASLAPLFRWSPDTPTQIVLSDSTDAANGYASPVPYNRIVLFVTTPQRVIDHGDWLQNLITHEYVHILHLDKAIHAPLLLRRVLGRHILSFPNLLQPRWGIEGLATYLETSEAEGHGRGQSSEYDMLMRLEVAGGIKPLTQVNQRVSTWPGGTTPYLYGVEFYKYIARTYGKEAVMAWIDEYSDNLVPYRLNSNSKRVFGKDLHTLFAEFERDLQTRYGQRLASIERSGEVEGERLTHLGYATGFPRVGLDGTLYFVASDARQRPYLARLEAGGAGVRKLVELNPVSGIDLHEQAGLLVSQLELCDNVNSYFDLYHVDPASGEMTRLTHCGRYRTPAWSPEGGRIVAVKSDHGESALVLLNAAGTELETLWQGQEGEVVLDLDWSPDGEHILAAVWRRNGGWNLEEFSLAQRSWQLLTAESALELNPQYTSDARAILYSADYDGIYNLRRLDLASGEITTLTNVKGGAFAPTRADGGPIFYVGQGPEGRDIYRLDLHLSEPIQPLLGPSVTLQEPAQVPGEVVAKPYTPWFGLKPRWWSPYAVVEGDSRLELGAMTSAYDPLLRHSYSVLLGYDTQKNLAVGSFDYFYNRWQTVMRFGWSRWHDYPFDNGLQRIRRSDTMLVALSRPWLSLQQRWALHGGLIQERDSDVWIAAGQRPLQGLTDRVVGLAVSYDTTYLPALGVSPQGRNLLLMAEYSGLLGGDFDGEAYTLDWREYFRLPRQPEQTLGVRVVAGHASDGAANYSLGGSDSATFSRVPASASLAPFVAAPFKQRRYALRGYPADLTSLRGNRLLMMSAEWRFPLKRLERGWMAPPMGVRQLWGALFLDAGDGWYDEGGQPSWKTGAGVELIIDSNIFYLLDFSLRLGYAHGFNQGGEEQIYLRLGSSF